VTTKLRRAQACSVVGRAVECMCGEKSREVKMRLADGRGDGRGGSGVQTTADTPGARLPPVYRFSSPARPIGCSESRGVPHFFPPEVSGYSRTRVQGCPVIPTRGYK
jgi:hypothetical protein